MISFFKKILSCFELHPKKTMIAICRLPFYLITFNKFKRISSWQLKFYPCLFDRDTQSAKLGEYFWQDMYVAKKIIQTNPRRHIDVGSRIDGFIAHLACVRHVEVFDIRPLNINIDNVTFQQWDVTKPSVKLDSICDCVTCLHTLEHIGLGRYGDNINPDGWEEGLKNLSKLLEPGGGFGYRFQ